MSIAAKRKSKAPERLRRDPDAVRSAAIAAARELLLREGPLAITLKSVGEALGMTHANLLHHFGSAGGLQLALMNSMVEDLSAALEEASRAIEGGQAPLGALVDIVFDAFAAGGAGRLAAWLILSGNATELMPLKARLEAIVAVLEKRAAVFGPGAAEAVPRGVLAVAYQAFADAVIGAPLRQMLGLKDADGLDLAKEILPQLLISHFAAGLPR